MLKRTFDIAASAAGLVILSPVLCVLAVLVKGTSPGPVLFLQERVGRNFRRFRICKFRTMVVDAASRGGAITAGGDPRVTSVGRFLRKTKLDELPQLWNVLRGDMSLVGPRPEVPRYVERFRDEFSRVLTVRPGITDHASLEFRDEERILARAIDPEQEYVERVLPEKLRLSQDYVQQATFLGDVMLILRTLGRVVRPRPDDRDRKSEAASVAAEAVAPGTAVSECASPCGCARQGPLWGAEVRPPRGRTR
jgi:lipopolysaccharide/colanic/teichoic acid biosynthesis glycosyltransferase